jgi:hypothetical protein
MAKRKRKHIPLKTKLAAALACMLPDGIETIARHGNWTENDILAMFEWDHIVLHSWGGGDEWFNLHPMMKAEHRAKSRLDTKRAAKVKRIRQAPQAVAGMPKPARARVDASKPVKRTTDRPMAGTVASGWRRKFDGRVERR